MNILENIIAHKRNEVEKRKQMCSVKQLQQTTGFNRKTQSLKAALQKEAASGIIAEFKRKSPSKGIIHASASVEKILVGYMNAGSSALSILTDNDFFGGSDEDLRQARAYNYCPILRKDFIVDEYQIVEAKSIGADVILLIAAALHSDQIRMFASVAKMLELEVILEVHNEEELDENIDVNVDVIGVNNRNLKSFETDLDVSRRLSRQIPDNYLKISESGISSIEVIHELKKEYGYQGFLIGENFMKTSEPEKTAKEFIDKLKEYANP